MSTAASVLAALRAQVVALLQGRLLLRAAELAWTGREPLPPRPRTRAATRAPGRVHRDLARRRLLAHLLGG